jgi:NADH-quinone oxidoreductase subunit N
VCLLSLAGFPPFAGFVGKFLIFGAAVEAGWVWLAVVGVLNSLVSVYFYLRPVVQMYMNDPVAGWDNIRVAPLVGLALLFAVAGVVALGVFPSPAIAFAQFGLMR